ncbi:hypothetical protein DRO32_03445 [Candidatus Bathyarchaeota archaeon]|nr:MAG: hypothetical protein DRO32_03445 [Candidatus Bathyarchaeota archaeon]
MNEYSRGVLDALGWVLEQLEELGGEGNRALEELRRRIRDLLEHVVRSSGSGLGLGPPPSIDRGG